MSGPVDVLAENVEVRLWDSQWVNVVNHADCYRDMDKEEAIATAVRMTERLMAENITKGFPPSAYNRVAVAELQRVAIFVSGRIFRWRTEGSAPSYREWMETEEMLDAAIARVGGAK